MDFLNSLIAKKRQQIEETKQIIKEVGVESKYIRKRELVEAEEKARASKRRRLEEEQLHSGKKPKTDDNGEDEAILSEDDKSEASLDTGTNGSAVAIAKKGKRYIVPEEVKRRLRAMGEPITLFGESDEQRIERLKQLEITQHERQTGRTGSSNAFNEILELEVAAEIQQATADALERERGGADKTKVSKEKEKLRKKLSKYEEKTKRDQFDSVHEYCLYFFKRILHEWENDLVNRSEAEKRTNLGKHASAIQKQTRHNIRPLFNLFKSRAVPDDLLEQLELIVDCCNERNYVKANEHYLLMSIGNAAWPIGVTMVGIHERSGREKIFSKKVAHVLNDETQRKYIQAVKRLMTYCQRKRPNFVAHDGGTATNDMSLDLD